MIPRDSIDKWRNRAPWSSNSQVEQDLALSRALIEIFSNPTIASGLALRGGTAINKLHFEPAPRYSEDIDLVQIEPRPIGRFMDQMRAALNPWLGRPRWDQTDSMVTFRYRFDSEEQPPAKLRLKIEINSREHFTVFGHEKIPYRMDSDWFNGNAEIVTYNLDELLATKLRALYQRKKGRDLFDLATGLNTASADPDRIVNAFSEYIKRGGGQVSRIQFTENLQNKLRDPEFNRDISPLLSPGYQWDLDDAVRIVSERLIARLPVKT